MLCSDCDKRDSCVELCDDMRQELKKVTHKQRESQVAEDFEDFVSKDAFYRDVLVKGSLITIKNIYYLHRQGKSQSEIAYHLPCSRQYISRVVKIIVQLKKRHKQPKRLIEAAHRMLKKPK